MQLGYSPKYVLDEMQFYEANAAMKYSHYAHKDNWEQARLISYLIAQTNSTKHLTVEDIIKFPWEKEEQEKEIKKEDIERLKKQAQQYIKNNFNTEKR